MSKKIKEDTWVNCPECKIKLKQENFIDHIKHIHNKKMENAKINSIEISNKKRRENITKRIITKTSIVVIIFFILVAAILVYFLSYSKESNNQNDKKTYFVSIDGKGTYSSIQKAIDSASINDTIYVSNGTYFENIKIKKPITLIGEDKNITIINGNGSGIVINISADYVKISGFTITKGGSISTGESNSGIFIKSSYNTISDCNISNNNNYGLNIYVNPKSTHNIIKNNIFSNNKYGIFAFYAQTSNISSNIFRNNTDYGMYLQTSSNDNLISNNIFTENNYAIRIKGSEENTIIKNIIMNNKMGIYFCCGAKNNIVYNNNFINNTNYNANDYQKYNKWNNELVGNYWDDYNGTDANSDGIGDTSYQKNLIKGDSFPLMKPT